MLSQTKSQGVTFLVHDVEPVLTPLATKKTRELLKVLLKNFDSHDATEPLYLSGYNSESLEDASTYNALFSTIHLAFSQHRPLVISPDMIWVTILQGVAQHVKNNSEELRHLLVNHSGRKNLVIEKQETFIDSPEYDWQDVVQKLAKALNQFVPDHYSNLVSNFSTTGPLERVVSEIALLDVFQSYFEYIMYCICGIPQITLEGCPQDWEMLKEKVEFLASYKLDWWLPHLREITEQFCRASKEDVDIAYWQDIYKQMNSYGSSTINGWIVKLIPYVKSAATGEFTVRNPVLSEDSELWSKGAGGIRTCDLPSGLSQVPFTIQAEKTQYMQFLAGFTGGEQDSKTFALRPMLGWAVRKVPDSLNYLVELPENVEKMPPLSLDKLTEGFEKLFDQQQKKIFQQDEIPGELFTFYKLCNGLNHHSKTSSSWKVRSLAELERQSPLNSLPERIAVDETEYLEILASDSAYWLRFLDESDGSYLALELGNKFQVWRVDAASGEIEVNAPSFEKCIRAYLEKVRS
ncbi:MAG: DUF4419 domain-containing protein [Candidatus Melainabacteria bacterium]|nr:DUF4419 domain-containing protein [Candidatus Melainabacteria bacterium]